MRKIIIIVVLGLLWVSAVWADFTPTTPGDILNQYHAAAVTWEATVFGYAQDLFYLLAVIELSWTFLELFLQQADLQADRKSTRLNSSHTVISYAVFCLKKKKKRHTQHHHHRRK